MIADDDSGAWGASSRRSRGCGRRGAEAANASAVDAVLRDHGIEPDDMPFELSGEPRQTILGALPA